MGCDEFSLLMMRGLESGLGREEERYLESHLAVCERCRGELEAQRSVAAVLWERPSVEVSAIFTEQVMTSLIPEPSWLELLNWRLWTLRMMPVAAGLILAAVFGMGSTDVTEPTEFTDLVNAWMVEEGTEVLPAFNLLLQREVPGDTLLEAVLTASLGRPVEQGQGPVD